MTATTTVWNITEENKMKKWFSELANRQMLFRRLVLIWAMTIITYVIYVVTDHQLLIQIGAAGATIVTGIIGILTTVIGFYQWHRQQDDNLEVLTKEDRQDDQ